jgi:hypothetical protein
MELTPSLPSPSTTAIALWTASKFSHDGAYFFAFVALGALGVSPALDASVALAVKARTVSPTISSAAGFPP